MRTTEEKRPLGRPRHRWIENIKMNLRDIRSIDRDSMDLPHDRVH
jgi:hypothetical protein